VGKRPESEAAWHGSKRINPLDEAAGRGFGDQGVTRDGKNWKGAKKKKR